MNNYVFLLFLLFPSSLCSAITVREKDMEQQAKEELEMLESLYPNRFQYLKLELKSFISQHHHHPHHRSEPSSFLSSMADTQESSNSNQRKRKKKKKSTADEDSEYCDQHDECYRSVKKMKKKEKKKDRVDLVLERAETCLRKIRQFKATLLSNS